MAPDTHMAFQVDAVPRPKAAAPPARLSPRVLLLAFAVLTAAILGAAWWMAGEFAASARSVAARHLATIVDLRMEQVIDWQSDRTGNARVIHGDTVLGEWIDELFGGIASEERIAALTGRLASVREGYGYHAVTLYDREGRVWLSADDGQPAPPAGAADVALVRQALAGRRVVNSDLMVFARPTDEATPRVTVHLHSAVPLRRHGSDRPVGVMVLSHDATRSLAAYLQGVETSGPRVDLRLVPDQPGDTPVLGAGAHLGTLERLGPATLTAYAEARRIGEAAVATRGESGRPVLAIARAIPETSWQLVARIEMSAIEDANLRERNQLLALALVGVVLVASVLVALRRDHELNVARTRLAAQASLDESEARFHMFMDNSPAIAFLKDERGRLLYTNVAFRRAFGFDDKEWFGHTTEELWPANTAGALMRNDRMVLESDAPGLFEQDFTDARGTTVWLVSKFPFRDSSGRRFLGGTAVDITERRRQEEALRRRTMALAASSRCGDILARDLPEESLLAEICRAIVEETGCRLAWVGYALDDGAKSVRAMARAGVDAGYVDGVAMRWADTERGRAPVGTAIRTGRPVVVRDIHTDPDFRPWREEAARRGFGSVLGLPIALGEPGAATEEAGGHVIGALSVYAAATDAFGAEEVALFRELAAKLALGIARERERAERRRVEAALRESEQRYRRLFTGAKAVELLIDPADGRIVDANQAAERFYGWPRDTLTAMRIADINCLTAEEIAKEMAVARAQDRSHFEFRHRLASGEVRDVEVHSGPIMVGDRELLYSIVHDVTDRRRAERALAETTAALERSNAELQRLAMQDALTGVSNRRHFTAVAERDIALARRHHRPLSVLMIDIDHFKTVNDTHGHAVGDEVLRALVGVMTTVLRATDHLGRHGGEEFVVLLPDTALDGAAASAERLRAAVAATALQGRDGAPLACTISVGATEWSPADATIEAALKRADAALYEAKAAGRNAVRCAMPEAVA
ncbi:MAG TPA: diguanylate cyclase [Azospirillum sp.]|nr:diguanylate cyclase [Azospirillum sp.]